MPAAMSEPLYGIVGIDQSETTRGNKGYELAPERGEKRGGIRRYRTFGSNKFDPSGIFFIFKTASLIGNRFKNRFSVLILSRISNTQLIVVLIEMGTNAKTSIFKIDK